MVSLQPGPHECAGPPCRLQGWEAGQELTLGVLGSREPPTQQREESRIKLRTVRAGPSAPNPPGPAGLWGCGTQGWEALTKFLLCPLCPVSRCQQGALEDPVLRPKGELVLSGIVGSGLKVSVSAPAPASQRCQQASWHGPSHETLSPSSTALTSKLLNSDIPIPLSYLPPHPLPPHPHTRDGDAPATAASAMPECHRPLFGGRYSGSFTRARPSTLC